MADDDEARPLSTTAARTIATTRPTREEEEEEEAEAAAAARAMMFEGEIETEGEEDGDKLQDFK